MVAGLPEPLPSDPDERLTLVGQVLVDRIVAALPTFLAASTRRIVDAWGRLAPDETEGVLAATQEATPETVAMVEAELRATLGLPAAQQRHTPIELVSTATAMPTAILQAAGIPGVVRDPQVEAIHPTDIYDLAPRSLADLGDPELGPLQLAWGLAKHDALRNGR